MSLISRCSGPVLRSVKSRRLRGRFHGALRTFCKTVGAVCKCVQFTFLANIAGFNGIDIFDTLGGLVSLSVSRHCITLYNVARRRVQAGLSRRLCRLTSEREVNCRRIYHRLGTYCSKCRFIRSSVNVCGPFDLLGAFCGVGFKGC